MLCIKETSASATSLKVHVWIEWIAMRSGCIPLTAGEVPRMVHRGCRAERVIPPSSETYLLAWMLY